MTYNIRMQWIIRPDSVSEVREAARHFPAVLVTGPRQAGKTALLRDSFPDADFLSFDLPSVAAAAEENPDELLSARGPVLLDEVQYAPGVFRHLKARIDEDRHKNGRFLMTGSHKFSLMQAVSESLAGRCAIIELDTLSAHDIDASLKDKAPTTEALLARGGYPELYRTPKLSTRMFFQSYVASYLERDVRNALGVTSLRDFERFLRALAARSAQLLNLTEVGRDVGIAATTAKDWLRVLEASGIVVLLEPWFGNVTKRLIKTPKLYFRDSGLMCFLLGIHDATTLSSSPFVGAIWETFVCGQLLRDKTRVVGDLFFWRDAHGTEVDFVIDTGGVLRLIECKWSDTIERGRATAGLHKVAQEIGERAAERHVVACRTKRAHSLAGAGPAISAVNGRHLTTWLKAARLR